MTLLKPQWNSHLSCTFSSVQFSRSVMSDSLRPHELQHARPPCPSPTPGVHSNSCPSSQWCHPAISSPVIPLSSCPQSLSASESFPMSQLFTWGGVGSHVRHYWQNGGTVPSPLSSFRRHGSWDEGVRPCYSDLSFPLLSWVDWKGILRGLLLLRGPWEGTKSSAAVLRE